jgi:hypothetical protein
MGGVGHGHVVRCLDQAVSDGLVLDLSLHYSLDYAVSFYGNEDGITEKGV